MPPKGEEYTFCCKHVISGHVIAIRRKGDSRVEITLQQHPTQKNQAKNTVPYSYRFTLYGTSNKTVLSKDFLILWAISQVLFILKV